MIPYLGNTIFHIFILVYHVVLVFFQSYDITYQLLSLIKQLYYNIIYPHISYAITAWASTYKSNLKKLQTKQNQVMRIMFFAITHGPLTKSALPYLNMLEILSVDNLYGLSTLKFRLIYGTKADCHAYLTVYFSILVTYLPITPDIHLSKTCTKNVSEQPMVNS
jgi:hypothetical protein